jgi:citrate synthase
MGYFPALIAYAYQAKSSFFDNASLHLHNPKPELSTAENILRMIRPTGEYTEIEAKILDICLVLHAEHGGGNNSTFTTHVISSSGSDTYATISAAVGSLKGPKHGGANIAVISMLEDLRRHVTDITDKNQIRDYLIKVLKGEANDKSGLVYGMGHAIYTLSDPRAEILKGLARELAKAKGQEDDLRICEYIEELTPGLYAEISGVNKPMAANVDLYSGFVYNALNIPADIATPLFAVARLSGWAAHRLEELIAGKRLIRPAYVNVLENRTFVPLAQRTEPAPAQNGNGNGKAAPKPVRATKAKAAKKPE